MNWEEAKQKVAGNREFEKHGFSVKTIEDYGIIYIGFNFTEKDFYNEAAELMNQSNLERIKKYGEKLSEQTKRIHGQERRIQGQANKIIKQDLRIKELEDGLKESKTIRFALYLTGHDEATVLQMFNDWNK